MVWVVSHNAPHESKAPPGRGFSLSKRLRVGIREEIGVDGFVILKQTLSETDWISPKPNSGTRNFTRIFYKLEKHIAKIQVHLGL